MLNIGLPTVIEMIQKYFSLLTLNIVSAMNEEVTACGGGPLNSLNLVCSARTPRV